MLCLNVFSQIAPPKKTISLNLPVPSNQTNIRKGPIMLAGGALFIAAGLLTPPIMVGGSTTQKKSPIHQMQRILPIASGSLIFIIGVGVSIGGN